MAHHVADNTGNLRVGVIGCGFFAQNHLHAWAEVDGVAVAAVCDADAERAQAAAERFGLHRVYTNVDEMLRDGDIDFVDIITQPHTHRDLVERAARHGHHVICQKPMAPTLEDARAMVDACAAANVRLMIHENFRWQRPMLAVKDAAANLGPLHFGRIAFRSGHDVFANQPYLAEDERFIIYDLGVHLLDLARFFMGEPQALACTARRVNRRIRGEDVATALLTTETDGACVVEASYASKLERELFPQTLVHLEGERGSVTLGADFELTLVVNGETHRQRVAPPARDWMEPPATVIQDSVVAIQQHWADCLRRGREPATSGADNLRTLALVFACYESVAQRSTVQLGNWGEAQAEARR